MPEEVIIMTDIQTVLENLEEYNLDNHLSRIQNYNIIQNALAQADPLDAEMLKRLLAICVHDMTLLKYTSNVFSIIPMIVSKIKAGNYDPPPDLTPSALALIGTMKKIVSLSKADSLMVLCHDTLLSYPDSTLIALAEHNEYLIELLNLYCQLKIPMQTRMQTFNLLLKLLKILLPEKKKVFVVNGIPVWFSKVIPLVMVHIPLVDCDTNMTLEVLELLTDDLVNVDFTDSPQWRNILECICNTKQYPAIIKTLLQSGNGIWHRLWIVFIRLLKHQITQQLNDVGTPINSMLPVVEAAFKLDVVNRCKAFNCWSVLIDSFSTVTNDSNINKRLKLLLIPLKSNNAKAELAALAKFKCWWNLMIRFQNRMDKYHETIVVSFLFFCVGKHNASDQTAIAPGQLSENLKKHSNQAIVDLVGHVNCDGCTDLPKLKGKMITTKHLVDNWNHWVYSLTYVIMKTATNDIGLTKQQMRCLWKSFLMTIGELPENNVRKDLFSEILSLISRLVQECQSNIEFIDIAFNVLILSLFEEDAKIKPLLKSTDDPDAPLIKIMKTVIVDSSLYGYYKSLPANKLVTKLKAITDFIMDIDLCVPKAIIGWILEALPINDFGLMLWDALCESIFDTNYDKSFIILNEIIIWPIKSMHIFTEVKMPAMTWYTTYNWLYTKLNRAEINKEIIKLLSTIPENMVNAPTSTVYFKLCVVLSILKYEFTEDNCMTCETEINMLHNLIKNIDNYEDYAQIYPMLVDRIAAIMSILTKKENDTAIALILICVKNVLHVLIQASKQKSDISHISLMIGTLLTPLESLFAVESYSKQIPAMTYHLINCSSLLSEHSTTQGIFLSVIRSILAKAKIADADYTKINTLIHDIENGKLKEQVIDVEQISENNRFSTPLTREGPKQIKKKEPNIVNTVVENGEEYVVVKSNWKFNPKKLTENQKEKLQRKREDIPALYQDLSQSQDEFKLVSWKTDSQDTTSSSKSESKSSKADGDVTAIDILKTLPSTDVVPKILETFLSENETRETNGSNSHPNDHVSKIKVSTPSVKNTKSHRMALKDRVFRNVRNLIENSGLQKENKESSEDPNKADNNIKTPTNMNINSVNIVNSAPPLLSADRPSRVKRKPKKFEDLQLLTLKRSRHSLQDVQTDKEHQSCVSVPFKNDTNKDAKDTGISTPQNVKKKHSDDLPESHEVVTDNKKTVSHSSEIIPHIDVDMNDKTGACKSNSDSDVIMIDIDKDEGKYVIMSCKSSNHTKGCPSPKISQEVTKAEKDNEVPTTKIGSDKELSTSKASSAKEVSTPKTSNVKEVLKPKAPNDKEMSTPKASCAEEVSTPIASNDKEVSAPMASNDKEVSTPKASSAQEVSTPTASNGKEVFTPKASSAKEVSTPKASSAKAVSTPMASNDKEVSTPKASSAKEVSAPKASSAKEVSAPMASSAKEVSTPMASNGKEVSTPKASNDKEVSAPKASSAKEVSTPMASIGKEVSTPKASSAKEVSTPMASIGKEVSTPKASSAEEVLTLKDPGVKEVSTPQASNGKEMSTPKASSAKEVATPQASNSKEVSTPKAFSSKVILNPKTSGVKDVSTPQASNGKEVSTPKTSNNIKDISTPKTSNQIKYVSTPKSSKVGRATPKSSIMVLNRIHEVSSPKSSKDIEAECMSTPIVCNDEIDVPTPTPSTGDSESITTLPCKEFTQASISCTLSDSKVLSTIKKHKEVSTPKQPPKGEEPRSTAKRSTAKKSRIEKELAIDTVEGHPYLKIQSEKRLTRKALESANVGRRKTLEKLNKTKSESISSNTKSDKKTKEKNKGSENTSSTSIVVDESQERDSESKQSSYSDELTYSDDVIESSQDSTITTISVKSTRKTPKKIPVVCVEKIIPADITVDTSQGILNSVVTNIPIMTSTHHETKDDSMLPLNKTVIEEKSKDDLTENMDTEPLDERNISGGVTILIDTPPVVTIVSQEVLGPETQEIAEADTQPTDPKDFMDVEEPQDNLCEPPITAAKLTETTTTDIYSDKIELQKVAKERSNIDKLIKENTTANDITVTLSESACANVDLSSGVSSPFKDEAQRQKDFMNNTLEISPIKNMSPDRNKKSPSPETSSDYVVIKLSSPVHSNGEPFVKNGSPEVFTEEKISPDKRDQSPPRVELSVTSTSPTSSLSLKKNRPQVRAGGRAAQMLGLCVPDKVQAIVNPERNELEEVKKSSTSTPARRNLRILYSSVGDNTESSSNTFENDDNENFLKFRRSLPAVDSSPSGPILKRKFAEITDDTMVSPASKRKRVSFHDPPVSTTISVQKYIEPGGLRSPQNSAQKRLERQLRQHAPLKSPKRLDSVFKLDTVLTKTVESFSDDDVVFIPSDTQQISLDATPIAEIVRPSELNDVDPICPQLIDCKDSIENIAGELSSPTLKTLLVKALQGKIETIGDLAKMTELEVNRLSIKAPKVTVAKQVLADYVSKKAEGVQPEAIIVIDDAEFEEPMSELVAIGRVSNMEVQTDTNESKEQEMQTADLPTTATLTQTESIVTANSCIQTDESGSMSTAHIIKSCLAEKSDFVAQLGQCLETSSIEQLNERLPLSAVTNLLLKKMTTSDIKLVLNRILECKSNSLSDKTNELSFMREYLCDRFDSKDLVLLCSQLLKSVYDKTA